MRQCWREFTGVHHGDDVRVPDPAGYGERRPRLDLDRVMLER